MSKVAKATIIAWWGPKPLDNKKKQKKKTYEVQYNPKELVLEKALQHGEIAIPGLDAPLQQYIRGQAEKLTVELFFDTTKDGMGLGAKSVTKETDEIYKLSKINGDTHAPPIVEFCWNSEFPGSSLAYKNGGGSGSNLNRNSFFGVVESVRQQFTLFSSEGVPLRATVNLVLKEYRTLEEQLHQMRLNSPDKSHSHPLLDGETLSSLADEYYNNSRRWRSIARQNHISDPRRLQAGDVIDVPSINSSRT